MYICKECGITFEEPKEYSDLHPCGDSCVEEKWEVCPHCDTPNIVEAKVCKRCGDYAAETSLDLCDVCFGDLYGE